MSYGECGNVGSPEDAAEDAADSSRIEKAASALAEHYDSVGIFVTRHGLDGNTGHWEATRGNNFAVAGQLSYWTEFCNEVFRLPARDIVEGEDMDD
jgi:hypothetical protein